MNDLSWLDKFRAVASLQLGDTVMLTSGKTAEFVRMKQKKFVGIMNGISYDIHIELFTELVKKANQSETTSAYETLQPGEAFYINKSGRAGLYYFVAIQNNHIIGINPISKQKTRIESSMFAGKVADFKL